MHYIYITYRQQFRRKREIIFIALTQEIIQLKFHVEHIEDLIKR